MKKLYLLIIAFMFISTFSNAQTNIDSGLVAVYHFYNNTADSGPNGYNATNYGCTFTTDPWGFPASALLLTGSSYITLPDAVRFPPLTSSSFCCWLKTTQTSKFYLVDQRQGSGTPSGYNYGIIFNQAVKIQWVAPHYNPNALPTQLSSNVTNYNDGNWHYFVFVKNCVNNTMYIYLDGAQIASCSFTDVNYTLQGTMRIGVEYLFDYFLTGALDEIRIYHRALSPAEVIITSVKDNSEFNSFINVFPSLSNGLFHIESDLPMKNINVEVFDLNGQKVISENFKNTESLSANDFFVQKAGIYIVRVSDAYRAVNKKMVVAR
jgi:hypothetical protein